MAKKYSTIQQHEPLRVPDNWNMQEKRFVAQLEEVLDDIYKRFGRLREEDLGENLRKTIVKSAESASEAIQTANSFETKISNAEGNASSALQTANSFKAEFQSIGTIAPQKGVTKIDETGLTITHSNIGGKTQISADGMRMFDSSNRIIGGVYKKNNKVISAVQTLYNPSSSSFEADVGSQASFNGTVTGLRMLINSSSTGVVGAYSDSRGNLGLGAYTNGRVVLQSGLSDSGDYSQVDMRNNAVYISSTNLIELAAPNIRFIFEDENGYTFTKTMSEIFNMIIDLM